MRSLLVHLVLVLMIGYLRAYDVPINTRKLDFWDTNQIAGWPERPSPRAHHSMTYLQRMLFIFAGVGSDGALLGDIHFYDTRARHWSGEVAREWCCHANGKVVDVERGYQPPVARAFHAAVADEQAVRMYIFGGYNDEVGDLDDLHYFDPKEMRWSGPLDAAGPKPTARSGHVAFLKPHDSSDGEQTIYVFGGYSSLTGHLSDLYKLSIKGDIFRWSKVTPSGMELGGGSGGSNGAGGWVNIPPPRPSGRRHAAVAMMPSTMSPQAMMMVGGLHAPTALGVNGNHRGGNRSEGSAVVFGDAWQLKFSGGRVVWQKLDVDMLSAQGLQRFHHTCIPSPDGTRLLITGGRHANMWSGSSAHLGTSTSAVSKPSSYLKIGEGTMPPSAQTFNIETATLTPGTQASTSPMNPCRSPSGIPEIPLSWASLDGYLVNGSSKSPIGRFGHATTYNEGWIYEFGGYGDIASGAEEGAGDKAFLLEAGLMVSYLAEGRDGTLCPVWIETL